MTLASKVKRAHDDTIEYWLRWETILWVKDLVKVDTQWLPRGRIEPVLSTLCCVVLYIGCFYCASQCVSQPEALWSILLESYRPSSIETIDHSGNLPVFYLRTRQQETACRPFSRRHCCACWRAFASSSFFYSTEHRWTTCWRSFRSWYHLRNRPTWTLQGAARSASDHSCISMWPRWCRPSLWTASRKRPIERRRRPALDYLRHQIINCIGCILMYSRK